MSAYEILQDHLPIEKVVGYHSDLRGNKAHCVNPNHLDANPSMHLYGEHVHCFSCGFHGDVTDVWAAINGFDRPIEAALDLAREYGVELPEQDPEAKRWAERRRNMEDVYLGQAWACHRALDKCDVVREWWEDRGFDGGIRERFLLGATEKRAAAVIPFWNGGRVQGLIHRKLKGEPKYLYPKSEEFASGYRPLFIPGSLRSGAYLVEGIVDALAVAALGESVVAVGGTGISEEQMRELVRISSPLYILPDADEEGDEAGREWARKLYPKALLCPAEYGGEASYA